MTGEVVQTTPTIGSNVEEIIWRNIHFLMWDIGGQESLRTSWSSYYTQTDFVIIVIDSTDRKRLSIIREQMYTMLAHEVSIIKNVKAFPVHKEYKVFVLKLSKIEEPGPSGRETTVDFLNYFTKIICFHVKRLRWGIRKIRL